MNQIQVNNVCKKYQKTIALDGVSCTFEKGKIYGLLGRNGAGKSTLINIISNRLFSDKGEVLIDGMTARENSKVHQKIYCMTEADLYEDGLKVKELFLWTHRFYGCFDLERAKEMANMFHLDMNKRIRGLSKGYQSIFKLIVTLCLQVPYVIYDEPVLGLDANHRELFYQLLLKDFEENQKTIIIATHLIEEIASIIEEVVIIDKGKLVLQEEVDSLISRGYSVSGTKEEVHKFCQGKNVIGYDELGAMKVAYILGDGEEVTMSSTLQISNMNLQKLFIKLTGGEKEYEAVKGSY